MRLHKPPRPLTPEEIAEQNCRRNIERILNPPKPSLRDRIAGVAWAVEEFWCRHVTQRELFHLLDNARQFAKENPGFLGAMRAEALRNGKVPADRPGYSPRDDGGKGS